MRSVDTLYLEIHLLRAYFHCASRRMRYDGSTRSTRMTQAFLYTVLIFPFFGVSKDYLT